MAAPVVVQSKTASYSASTTATVVLDAAPTPGNLLLTLHQCSVSSSNLTSLTGWTRRSGAANNFLHVHSRIVQAGDGTSYTWVFSASQNADVTVLEISGQSSTTFLGLVDEVLTPSSTVQNFPIRLPAPDSLMVIALRSPAASGGFSAASAGWTTHNQGAAGGSANLAGCYSRPFVLPNTNSVMTLTVNTNAQTYYTSFAIPGVTTAQTLVGQVAVETLGGGLPTDRIGQVVLETLNRGAGPVKVGQTVIELLHSGLVTVITPSVARQGKLPPQVS